MKNQNIAQNEKVLISSLVQAFEDVLRFMRNLENIGLYSQSTPLTHAFDKITEAICIMLNIEGSESDQVMDILTSDIETGSKVMEIYKIANI
jgi:dsDNA-specific endonuclease/ATPase MutS2